MTMPYLEKLELVLCLIEELMETNEFIDQLTGEDQSFLDTVWDYFDRIEAELNPEVAAYPQKDGDYSDTSSILNVDAWAAQQDAETD